MHINFAGDLDLSNFPTAEEARRLYETNFRQAYTTEASSIFNYIGETNEACKIKQALFKTFQSNIKTADLGGDVTCSLFTDEVIKRLN